MTGPIRDVESAVRELGALPMPAGPAPTVDELLADCAAMDFTDLMDPDAAAVVGSIRDQLVGEIQRLREERTKYVLVPKWEYELLEQQRARATRAEGRIDELEAERNAWPSRFSAKPAEVDWFLRKNLTEETLLNYQRAIGNRAVQEAAEEIRQETARLKAHGVLEPDKDWAASTAADWIDTSKEGGHYPAQLLCARHDGFNPCPGAPRCTPREGEEVAR